MTWKLGAAAGALLVLVGFVGSAELAAQRERASRRAEFRRPEAIPFPETNPYSAAKADLGRTLFFDPILSGSRTRACVTCHRPDLAWGDGRARAEKLDHGEMGLRSPTLLNLAWAEGRLGWDGKFRDLESVAFTPITGPANMGLPEAEAIARLKAHADYPKAFAAAFPDAPEVSRAHVEQALATYERLIVSAPAPFDRWVAGEENAIDASARRGFDLFTGKAHCAACHSGWAFTDGSFHDIGTAQGDDIGRGRLFPSSVALRYAFKTPTLRNVSRRAPYMHDGSIATLTSVVDLYDRGGIDRPSRSRDIRPLNLNAGEKADLIAFLKTLDEPVGARLLPSHFVSEPPRP